MMAAKKKTKKKTTRKNRSKAARKGWVTRRLNRQEAVLLHAFRKGDKNALKSLLGFDIPKWIRDMPPEMIKEHTAFLDRVREEKWVAAQDPEYTYNGKRGKPGRKYERGAIALMPSRARHLGRATDEALKMMRKAYKEGGNTENSAVFKNTMQRISQALDLPIKEIYTLWFS